MKIIHTSDLHLNSKIEKLSKEKAILRREEVTRTFERIVDYARSNEVRAIIIAGDMFDTTKISSKLFERVMHLIRSNENIDFLYLTGNHEQDSFLSLITDKPNNLKLFSNEWKYYVFDNVVIGGISVNESNVKFIYDSLFLDENNFNIITLHGQIMGYKNADKSEVISIPLLKDKNIDYLALGHYHSFAEGVIDNRGKYVYSGCPEGRGFDETGSKGFVLIDTESEKKYKFIPFATRELEEVSFDISNEKSWFDFKEKVLDYLLSNVNSNNLVKVIIKGVHELEFEMDLIGLNSVLNETFYFAKIEDQSEVRIDISSFELDKSFRGEFVRGVMNSQLTDNEKRLVILKGLSALKGEI